MESLAKALSSQATEETASALARIEDLESKAAAFLAAAERGGFSQGAAFLTWVGARLLPDDVERLASLKAADLALAYACAAGDREAQAVFVARYAELMARIGRRIVGDHAASDLVQSVIAKLLVGQGGERPRIERYTGRGDLAAWVRVVVTRDALATIRQQPQGRAVEVEHLAEAIASLESSPEMRVIKETHAAQFAEAFADAVAALAPRERNLLRYSLVEGVSIDGIGSIYGVHRATAARWVEKARSTLSETTKSRLASRLALDSGSLESLLELIWSAIDISLGALLRAPDPDDR